MRITSLILSLFVAVSAVASDPYVMKGGGKSRMRTGGHIDLESAIALAKRWDGDFFWIRRDGRAYLIRDAATLASMARLFAPVDALNVHYKALRARLDPLERREQEIDREIDRWEDRDDARVRALERALRDLERQLSVLEEREAALDRRQEQLEREAEEKLAPIIEQAIRSGIARIQ